MIVGLGSDLVEIARLEGAWRRRGWRLVERLLTPYEQAALPRAAPAARLARRFAAKEAIAKALGTGMREGIGWQQIEIRSDRRRRPSVILSGAAADWLAAAGGGHIWLSISDERAYALAMAVWEQP